MGVAVQLGLDRGEDSEMLVEAASRWSAWGHQIPTLAQVGGLGSLPTWLRSAEPPEADDALLGLARVGSPSGAAEVAASAVVAWALLPGACTLAWRLRRLSDEVDVLVAAQLWVEIRSFEWWRMGKVAANVLARTRCHVLAECGVSSQVRRTDPTWAATSLQDPLSVPWTQRADQQPAAGAGSAAELRALLVDADALGLLTRLERLVLDRLMFHADALGGARAGRGQGGLLADRLVAVVAGEVGVSPATVRRRARRAVQQLAETHRLGQVAA